MSYYDIDAILTDAQKLPCTFALTVPGLGHLDASPSHPLKSGTRVHLPLWLATILHSSEEQISQQLVTLEIPDCFSERVLNALKADPKSVDLRAQAQNYYAFGAKMLDLFEDDELLDVLTETLRVRAKEIGDRAANVGAGGVGGGKGGTEGVEFLRGLEEMERGLFRVSHESAKATRAWVGDVKKSSS